MPAPAPPPTLWTTPPRALAGLALRGDRDTALARHAAAAAAALGIVRPEGSGEWVVTCVALGVGALVGQWSRLDAGRARTAPPQCLPSRQGDAG